MASLKREQPRYILASNEDCLGWEFPGDCLEQASTPAGVRIANWQWLEQRSFCISPAQFCNLRSSKYSANDN